MKQRLILLAVVAASSLLAQSAETIAFRAILRPSNEVPPATIDATGAATVLVHLVRDRAGQVESASVDFLVSHNFAASTTFTGLHIHRGPAGINGPITIDSGISGTNSVISESGRGFIDRQGQVRAGSQAGLDTITGMLRDPGQFYVNLHTTEFPNGAIRGQLMRADELVLLGEMSTAKEVPLVTNLSASGLGAITAYVTRDESGALTSGEVVFDIAYDMPGQTTFTGLHIHRGTASDAGPVTIGTDLSGTNPVVSPPSGEGTIQRRVEVNLAQPAARETLERLFTDPQNFYVNLHSTTHPGGVIRSQLQRAETITFASVLSAGNEVPAVALDATAPGVVTVHALREDDGTVAAALVEFDYNFRFPGQTEFTGFHIHNGTAAENGPVTIDTGLSGANPVMSQTGFGNISRSVLVTGGAGLMTLNSALASPERHYVNLHTTTNPGGAVRAQLAPVVTAPPVVNAIISAVSDPRLTTLAPGGLFTIFGTNLARVAGGLAAFSGRNVPTSLNGVEVTVGGTPAPLVQVTPTYIVAQVPFGTVAGNPPVIVTNVNGRSTPFNVRVADQAPAIFFDAEGAIATDLSYRLIRDDNPARPGDRIWVYLTGLGGAGRTGFLSDAVDTISGITATLGGVNAPIITTVTSPGFIGLYQALIQIPEGVQPGMRPLVVTAGGASSNAAGILIR